MKLNDLSIPAWLRWIIGSLTLLGLSILVLSVVLGARAGQQLLETRSRQQIALTLQRAVEFHAQGSIEEAFDAYRSVLILDPDNPTATDGIAALLDRSGNAPVIEQSINTEGGNGSVTTTESAVAASSGASATEQTASQREITLFSNGQNSFQQGEWQQTIENLTSLKQSNPTYRSAEINELLYSAYFSLATQQEELNQVDQALQSYTNAIAVHPNPIGAEVAKEILTNYLNVLSMDDGNYPRLIDKLDEVYQADPNYRNISTLLQSAYEKYGDSLVGQSAWCDAVDQYAKASEISVTPGLLPKRERYRAQCTQDGLTEPPVASNKRTSNDDVLDSVATSPPNGQITTSDDRDTIPATASTQTATPTALTSEDVTDEEADPVVEISESVDATIARPSTAVTGRILYASRDVSDGRFRVFAQPANGSGQPNVLVDDGMQPAMRSDGARLVYRNMRSDSIGLTSFDPGTGLSLRFTDYGEDSVPHWSADGNRIVFASNREGDRLWRIFTVWAEVSGATSNQGFGEAPNWHPTQDLIAYRGCDDRGNNCGIWTMTGSGGGRRSLTSIQRDGHPAWSPDGGYVVFMSDGRDGNMELYRVTVGSSVVERLTNSPAIDGIPAVSPSGEWVAFLSNRNGSWGLWRVPLAGGEAELIGPLVGQIGEWQEQTLQWIP